MSHSAEQHAYRHMVIGPHPHKLPVWLYWGVFFALVALTVITVTLAEYDFGSWSIIVTLLIASTKAALVLGVFMHLAFDDKFLTVVFTLTMLFVVLFFVFPMGDVESRGDVDEVRENFLPRDEAVYQHKLKDPNALPLGPGLKDINKADWVFIGPEHH